ncbi:hypothetical protein KFL_009570050 [Klebsormidium nitens]|uniref:Uncharacterized protein n=1 Tax=Klebsormidium nitens TaxID=105231 RepID=A0A1Y1IQC4_KLENI|nr:hypothetical protein KFL_009570050 [Klebsormidium nitens]|eukprot:GAQ92252.1 hypothetical protein KFL_009570050 [Klebsormidium nitens]
MVMNSVASFEVARSVEVIGGDIQDVGVVVNKATLAYLVNVASRTLAAMYKQAHVDLQDADTWHDSDGAQGTTGTDGVAGSPERPTGYEMSADDEWGYDPEASNGYRVSIGGKGETGDFKARQQSLKAKLRSRYTGGLRKMLMGQASRSGMSLKITVALITCLC